MAYSSLFIKLAAQKAARAQAAQEQATPVAQVKKATIAESLAALKAKQASSGKLDAIAQERLQEQATGQKIAHPELVGKNDVTLEMLNLRQQQAISLGLEGKSFVLIGAAGYGKTTTVKLLTKALADAGRLRKFPPPPGTGESVACSTKTQLISSGQWLCGDDVIAEHKTFMHGGYRAAVISFTNVAVGNIREILPPEISNHCVTAHKLVEYCPEEEEVDVLDKWNQPTGETKVKFWYEPTYGFEPSTNGGRGVGKRKQLPQLDLIIVEEAATVPVWLFDTVRNALQAPDSTQWILLGDLNQLTPVMGDGILGYKMLELPIIELNEAYRNVGLITKLAHRVLTGVPISDAEALTWNKSDASGSIEFKPFGKGVSHEVATVNLGRYFRTLAATGEFNPDNTVVLIPFNKQLGTIELNKYIAQGFTDAKGSLVYTVQAGMFTHRFCVGDRVMYQKKYYEIAKIKKARFYTGTSVREETRLIDRWGRLRTDLPQEVIDAERAAYDELRLEQVRKTPTSMAEIDALLEASTDEMKTALKNASHELYLVPVNTLNNADDFDEGEYEGKMLKLTTSGAINELLFSYCLTVYKAQGSEWQNVYSIIHGSHAVALSREMVYTAWTRARRNLVIMFDGDKSAGYGNSVLSKALKKQEIPGKTIEEKLQFFRRKLGVDNEKNRFKALQAKMKESAAQRALELTDNE